MEGKLNTLNKLYNHALTKYGNRTALIFEGKKLSYQNLKKASNRVAHALLRHGVQANTRVALMMENCLEFVISDMGLVQAGGAKVPLNSMLGEKEIEYILNDSGAEIVIMGESFFGKFQNIESNVRNVKLVVGLSTSELLPNNWMSWDEFQGNELETDVAVHSSPTDIAGIFYTGGTTGVPKGVVHDQRNVIQNTFAHIMELEIHHDEKILITSPLPHSAGMVVLAGLLKGAEHWVEKGFHPQIVLNRIHENRITFTFMVPTMIYRVMDEIKDQEYNFSSLRTIMYGAAPITAERLKQGLNIFGRVFIQIYGQTEAPNLITTLRKDDHRMDDNLYQRRLRSCGQPVMSSLVKIVDDNGNEVPHGTEGEILASTPYNMKFYHHKPDATEETIVQGWVHTGDVGMLDEDGYLYLLDRKKDMIISGGMNVYTTEVENLIGKHPGVQLAAVIGVPHDDWGEAVMAVIIPSKENPPTVESIHELCQQLSSYKRPKEIKFVENIPLTPYGKIDKKALKSRYWAAKDRGIN